MIQMFDTDLEDAEEQYQAAASRSPPPSDARP